MAFPAEIARQFTEDKIAFVKRMNLKAEVLEPGFVRLRVPLAGNENHIGSMYAGALFTLAEIPGGALFLTSFDASKFYPIVKEMNLRFRRPATGDIVVEARLSAEEIERLQDQVIKPLEKAKQDAIQTVDDLEAGKIDAAQAQKALEEINETVEDAKSTLEEVTVDELEDEDDEDE